MKGSSLVSWILGIDTKESEVLLVAKTSLLKQEQKEHLMERAKPREALALEW